MYKKIFQAQPGLDFLSEDALQTLHFSTLKILERVGVHVHEEEALALLKGGGAYVEGNRVFIPPGMVKEALLTVPPCITIASRDRERALELEVGRSYFGTGSDTPFIQDPFTGERRATVKEDVILSTRLSEELPHLDFIMSLALASDVPRKISDLHHFEAMVLNTKKPILYTAHSSKTLRVIFEMASLVAGGERELAQNPFLVLYAEPSSPLIHTRDALEKLLLCAQRRLPVIYAPAIMLGATGPVTQAGSIVVANAEILSGLVIHQLKSPGAPFISGGGTPPLDMRTSICSYGDPRRDLGCISLVRLAQYYKVPVFTTAGCSDAQIFDAQAGMESGFNLLAAGLAGGNLIHDLGYIGVGMTASLEMLLLCNEAVAVVRRFLDGVTINEETLAFDAIEEVGPGGTFFDKEHTFQNFREEMTPTDLLNRMNYDAWSQEGKKTFQERAREKISSIKEREAQPTLPEDVVKGVKGLVERMDEEALK